MRFKLASKQSALDSLAKHLGMFVNVNINKNIQSTLPEIEELSDAQRRKVLALMMDEQFMPSNQPGDTEKALYAAIREARETVH